MSLIQTHTQPFFPDFTASFAAQSPSERERGRCALVDFSTHHHLSTTVFENAAELDACLYDDSSPPPYDASCSTPRRRLFILEDLPCNHILALGSRLLIPPSFFAGHWDDPASSTFNHRSPFERCALPNFRLRYGTSHRVEVDMSGQTEDSNIFAFDTNVRRYLHTYSRSGLVYDEARSHHNMSFWSSPVKEDGSWDAVLLVDPSPQTRVRCLVSQQWVTLHDLSKARESTMPKHFLHPELDTPRELCENASQWYSMLVVPQYHSTFDDILHMYQASDTHGVLATHEPLSATEIPRRLVISMLLAFIRRRYLNIVGIQKSQFRPHTFRHNYQSHFSQGNLSCWNNELYDFIAGSQAAIKEFSREMDDNVVALGLKDSRDHPAPQWEVDGWRSVQDGTRHLIDMTTWLMAGYLQYVTIQEAHMSNGSAQSLSRITVITMLFIPLSTVASIFSMSGDFLPGEARGWMFWIVAVPLLAVISYLYWHQVVAREWRRRPRSLLPLFECKIVRS